MSKNDITGDEIKTKSANEQYRENWDRIFGKKKTAEEALQEMTDFAQKHNLYNTSIEDNPLIKK